VGFEWLEAGLRALRGIEPYEVIQVLSGGKRWPVRLSARTGIRC
jgi:hypothetical protein